MQFVHQSLAWGFLLALLPLLIHLINLVRRRRIRWAAMEFLLQSYRKHRKWIWLKQWLLLLLRMAALALLVAMLAQWVSRQQWLSLFGTSATHHFVLLDDSYSMSERFGGSTAFDRATRALSRLAAQWRAQPTQQKVTLLRFSRAAGTSRSEPADIAVDRVADLNAEIVDARFDMLLEERRRQMEVTELSVGPGAALRLLVQLLEDNRDESNLVYLLSDFREKEWAQPAELRATLRELARRSESLQLVRCSQQAPANLAITELSPGEETRAAGVPLFVNVTVRNFGSETARRVPVQVQTTRFDAQVAASARPGLLQGQVDEPPTVLIEEIPPGETVRQRVQVFFPQAGAHLVQAQLTEDAVAADNRRWYVLDLPSAEKALVLDGSLQQRHAYYLSAAFQPGARARSGIVADLQPVAVLRDASAEDLQVFRTIYLLDVPELDERAVENLENFVRAGGGLAVFVGDQVNLASYNQRLYRGGDGLLPLPLASGQLLPRESFENVPDLDVENHPLFRIFLGDRNPLLRLVTVERYLRPPDDWRPPAESTVQVVARLRNGAPLVVERRFGQGRVVACLTTLAPEWNNWAYDPSLVVVLLKLESYLAAPAHQEPSRLVGTPLGVELDLRRFRPEVAFVAPGPLPDRPLVLQQTVTPPAEPSQPVLVQLDSSSASGQPGATTQRAGLYETWLTRMDGGYQVQRSALNVDPDEGDLSLADASSLVRRLAPVEVTVENADELAEGVSTQAGYNRSLLLMGLLVVFLLGEQALAYSASYHPGRT